MHALTSVLPYLIGISLAAVVVTLLTGLFTMARGGDFNRRYGNRLMRLRVGLQALTIVLFLLYVVLVRL